MSFRFDNDNLLAVYSSNVMGPFTFSVRELREDLWEWTIACGSQVSKTMPDGAELQFPLRGTAATRQECINKASILSVIDPDIALFESHDGKTRTSIRMGWTGGSPEGLYVGGPGRLTPDGFTYRSILNVDTWGDEVD